jgi:hypothetical protein
VSLPVRLRHAAGLTNATVALRVGVQMRGLTIGSSYSLIRFNSASAVPKDPTTAAAFLTAASERACAFVAAAVAAEYCDPAGLQWAVSYVYRLVANAAVSDSSLLPSALCASTLLVPLGGCPLA